eukprot:5249997-Pyramimonas_sp.AAC.1
MLHERLRSAPTELEELVGSSSWGGGGCSSAVTVSPRRRRSRWEKPEADFATAQLRVASAAERRNVRLAEGDFTPATKPPRQAAGQAVGYHLAEAEARRSNGGDSNGGAHAHPTVVGEESRRAAEQMAGARRSAAGEQATGAADNGRAAVQRSGRGASSEGAARATPGSGAEEA